MFLVPLWLCGIVPAALSSSVRCHLFSQNNRPVYECFNGSGTFGDPGGQDILTPSFSGGFPDDSRGYLQPESGGGTVLPTAPRGTMTFRIQQVRINTLKRVGNPQLVTLALNHCALRAVAPQAFAHSANLRQIDLSHNLLTHLVFESDVTDDDDVTHSATTASVQQSPPSRVLPYIERLNLANNRFETVPDLSGLLTLRDLDLSHNRIVDIAAGHLLAPRLDWIDLSHNELTHVQRGQFGASIRVLGLDGNPWTCDCELREFVAFQRESLVSRSLRCRRPAALRGVKWDDLALSVG